MKILIKRYLFDFSNNFIPIFCVIGVAYLLIRQGNNHLSIIALSSTIFSVLSIFLQHKIRSRDKF